MLEISHLIIVFKALNCNFRFYSQILSTLFLAEHVRFKSPVTPNRVIFVVLYNLLQLNAFKWVLVVFRIFHQLFSAKLWLLQQRFHSIVVKRDRVFREGVEGIWIFTTWTTLSKKANLLNLRFAHLRQAQVNQIVAIRSLETRVS